MCHKQVWRQGQVTTCRGYWGKNLSTLSPVKTNATLTLIVFCKAQKRTHLSSDVPQAGMKAGTGNYGYWGKNLSTWAQSRRTQRWHRLSFVRLRKEHIWVVMCHKQVWRQGQVTTCRGYWGKNLSTLSPVKTNATLTPIVFCKAQKRTHLSSGVPQAGMKAGTGNYMPRILRDVITCYRPSYLLVA